MTGIVNSTGAKSGIIGTTVGTPASGNEIYFDCKGATTASVSSQSDYEFIDWTSVQQNASDFNNGSGRFIAPKDGKYFFYGHALNYAVTTVTRFFIRKNNTGGSGVDYAAQVRIPLGLAYLGGSVQVIYQLDAGEYVSAWTETGYIESNIQYIGFGGYWIAS